MRAFIDTITNTGNSTTVSVVYIDNINDAYGGLFNYVYNFGVEQTLYTIDELRSLITASVLATAINSAWTMTSSDILWNIPNFVTPTLLTQFTSNSTARTYSAASRSLNSAFLISSTRECLVNYSIDIAATLSLITGETGTVILEYADNSGMSTNVVEVCRAVNGNTGTLAIGLNLTQNSTGQISGLIPAGKYVRIRTVNTTGTPTFNYRSGQEVLMF